MRCYELGPDDHCSKYDLNSIEKVITNYNDSWSSTCPPFVRTDRFDTWSCCKRNCVRKRETKWNKCTKVLLVTRCPESKYVSRGRKLIQKGRHGQKINGNSMKIYYETLYVQPFSSSFIIYRVYVTVSMRGWKDESWGRGWERWGLQRNWSDSIKTDEEEWGKGKLMRERERESQHNRERVENESRKEDV